jgi:hypothetical protein
VKYRRIDVGRLAPDLPFTPDLGLHEEPGMTGMFTREQAPGAWPSGSYVEKIVDEGDAHKVGAKGTALGSIGPLDLPGHGLVWMYFVQWDDDPRKAVGCQSYKLRKIDVDLPREAAT